MDALSHESSNLVSALESWFEEPEDNGTESWLDALQELIRPIIFVAHGFGGLVVEKVSNASLWSLHSLNLKRPYYKLNHREKPNLSLLEHLVLSVKT